MRRRRQAPPAPPERLMWWFGKLMPIFMVEAASRSRMDEWDDAIRKDRLGIKDHPGGPGRHVYWKYDPSYNWRKKDGSSKAD